jgi:transcriptional antiterminator RfaH
MAEVLKADHTALARIVCGPPEHAGRGGEPNCVLAAPRRRPTAERPDAAEPSWYAVQTHPHTEARAAAHLERQGFSIYLPRYLKRRRHARRVETVAAPLFPSYLFVSIDMLTQRWRSIQSTTGVSRLVCSGDTPAVLPAAVIDELQRRHDDAGFVQLDLRPRFAPGDRIRIVDGPFTACLGLYQGMADRDRVAILLDLLGRKVRMVLSGDAIATA